MNQTNHNSRRTSFKRLGVSYSIAAATLLLPISGFCIEILNTQGSKEIAEKAKLPGSVPTGWRVYQQRCASCHGPAGEGTMKAPNLLPRVNEMGSERFSNLVLKRYDWSASQPTTSGSAPAGQTVMPTWQSDPVVNTHIVDLYAYLNARATGTQGPGQPAP